MNIQSQNTRTIITIIVMIVIATALTWIGYHSLGRKPVVNSDNPYEFNIETYRQVPDTLIHYAQIRQIKVNLAKLHALAVTRDKRIMVCGDNSVQQFDIKGTLLRSFTLANTGQCMVVDENDRILLGTGNHIEIYDSTGSLLQSWPPYNENSFITSIAVSSDAVYAADAGKQVILHYDSNGTFINRIGERNKEKDIDGFIIPSPYFDVAVDPEGFVWAANTGRQTLENYTPNGDLRAHWGTASMRIEGFSGCCNPSHFAILSDGSFVTAEKGLERIKVYDRTGQFVSVVAPPTLFNPGTVGLDLAIDADDCIYVLDPAAATVRIFQHKNSIKG